ncbi:MAG: hydrogenase nickel incorporation protein HypB [Chlorobi bacterium]|nr:hydrogenase nickel incorporation protein HypB [Chlorobiota bacterium]
MCDTCGCGQPEDAVTIKKPGEAIFTSENNGVSLDNHTHTHSHNHHSHNHQHSNHTHGKTIHVETDILIKNNLTAERNRGFFEAKKILALNLVSSPGSGKTTLLEKTLLKLKNDILFYVIEGDQQTMNDADRINKAGVPVVQINTGNGCHLDGKMINDAVKKLEPEGNSVLFIENVGNLVCPSLFDLGESFRVVIISVTEGDDKPIKYPTMFESSDVCIINKIDLLPYVNFDIAKAKEYATQINRRLKFFELSAQTGEGLENWFNWIGEKSSKF